MEKVIVEWLKDQHTVNNCVPMSKLQAVAREAAVSRGLDPTSVGGADWLKRFWARHPDLSLRQGQLSDSARTTSMTRDNVLRFYDLLGNSLKDVKRENIWMADESGVEACPQNRQVSPSQACLTCPTAPTYLLPFRPPLHAGHCPQGSTLCPHS
jgi:hypothetical protein